MVECSNRDLARESHRDDAVGVCWLVPYILMLINRSYLERFSDCEFAQIFNICFSGSGECGHNSAAFGV